MKFGILILVGLLIIQADCFAQKNHRGYKLDQPHSAGKRQKLGFVGDNPSLRPKKVHFLKPSPGKSVRKRSVVAENKINKPKRQPKFIAAAKAPQNRNLRIPKQVTDKQMVLPKMKGDKKAKKVKYEIMGSNPSVKVNSHKEKRVNDIQYRSSYKFDKQGSSKKKFFRKNKKD